MRIKKMDLNGKAIFRNMNLDVPDNSLIGISGKKKEAFFQILLNQAVFEGDIILDEISLKGDEEEYFNHISVLGKKNCDSSTLSLEDYLDFIAVAGGCSGMEYEKKKVRMLEKMGLAKIKYKKINELLEEERKKVNFLSLFIKNTPLLIVKDFLCDFSEIDYAFVFQFMKEYTVEEKTILIIMDKEEICKLCNRNYTVN